MTPDERFMAGSAEIKAVLEKYQLAITPVMEMHDMKKPVISAIEKPDPIEILKP